CRLGRLSAGYGHWLGDDECRCCPVCSRCSRAILSTVSHGSGGPCCWDDCFTDLGQSIRCYPWASTYRLAPVESHAAIQFAWHLSCPFVWPWIDSWRRSCCS